MCRPSRFTKATNLKRSEIDFGEVHCQLLVVDTALKLGVYDERLREGIEMDSGLTLTRAGCKIMGSNRILWSAWFTHLNSETCDGRPIVLLEVGYTRASWQISIISKKSGI